MFIFACLALVKRYIELATRLDRELSDPLNRDYKLSDMQIVASLAAASGLNAVTVFALYISSDAVHPLYRHPELLWLICPVLMYWIGRILMMAHRRTGARRSDRFRTEGPSQRYCRRVNRRHRAGGDPRPQNGDLPRAFGGVAGGALRPSRPAVCALRSEQTMPAFDQRKSTCRKKAKILITGGAGLVGQNLIQRLTTRGYSRIVAIDKHPANTATLAETQP